MKYKELLKQPIQHTISGLDHRWHSWNWFDDDINDYLNLYKLTYFGSVKTHYIKQKCFDGTRTWELGYVTYDGKPCLFFYAYGRNGMDGYGSVRVNEHYDEFEEYAKQCCEYDDFIEHSVCTLDDSCDGIMEFYGYRFEDVGV